MLSPSGGPRRGRARFRALRAVLGPIRAVLVAMLFALARGLGGPPHVPRSDRRNLPAEVERER
jgi:hypothetical protein